MSSKIATFAEKIVSFSYWPEWKKKKHIEISNAFGYFSVIYFWEKVGFFALGHSFYIESSRAIFPRASPVFIISWQKCIFVSFFIPLLALNGVLPEDVYMVSLPESRKNPLESLEDLAEPEGEVTPTSFLGVS